LAENVYEGMYIFDPGRFARDSANIADRIEKMIKEAGGNVLVSRLWEERRLAYPIKGNRKGTYWLTYFRIDSEKLTTLNRQCEISDDIMRHLFIKIDERIADTLVSHADGSAAAAEAESKEAAAAEAESNDAESKDAESKAGTGDTADGKDGGDEAQPVGAAAEAESADSPPSNGS
jgi:small subunit ribosomal protein S6